jgi:hypothetical protein
MWWGEGGMLGLGLGLGNYRHSEEKNRAQF